jgi:hypothetical protein
VTIDACVLIDPPEPTTWGTIRFRVAATNVQVDVDVGWDWGAAIASALWGDPNADQAMRFVFEYSARHRLYMHMLLMQARQRWEPCEPGEKLEDIPSMSLIRQPRVEDGNLVFQIRVDDIEVEGLLTPALSWGGTGETAWAESFHYVLQYSTENRAALREQGFNTDELERQLAMYGAQNAAPL